MNTSEKIGKQIAESRKLRGLSQVDLAKLTGLAAGNIARIESGKYSTGINLIGKICEALKCEIKIIA